LQLEKLNFSVNFLDALPFQRLPVRRAGRVLRSGENHGKVLEKLTKRGVCPWYAA
jgi:hypothetical protein